MIEARGPESPGKPRPAPRGRITPSVLVASVIAAAIAGGAVAAGVTLGIARVQLTNQQTVDLGTHATISENSSAISVAQKALPAVISLFDSGARSSRGSGFLVTSDGYVVTDVDVVAGANGLGALIGLDSKRHDARLVDFDCATGVAVVKVDGVSNLPTLAFGDSTTLQAGQEVLAIGGALGDRPGVWPGSATALHGIVEVPAPAGLGTPGAQAQYANVIHTNLVVDSSDSGGPLLNVGGQVVGVIVPRAEQPGFALAASDIQPEVEQVIHSGQLTVPGLGTRTTTVTAAGAGLAGGAAGARITELNQGGPAEGVGLKVGDVVTQIDDQKVDDAHPLPQVLVDHFKPAQKVTVGYSRSGSAGQVQLTLAETRPACP